MTGLQRKDIYLLGFLFLVVLVIFYPVFFTEYAYTDEIFQIWNYRPGSGMMMFAIQGRWLTELMVSKTFSAIDSIREITYIRIFSLVLWMICIPVWYVIIKRVVAQRPGYEAMPFFVCLFLVTSLQFSITVQWASCVELAIANTAGLLSGTIWHLAIRDKEKFWSIPVPAALGATAAALVSMAAYQSGFGCFVIPFLIYYITSDATGKDAVFIKGIGFYFAMYALYFVLFKLSLAIAHITSDARAGFTNDVPGKIAYFITQPLKRAFWFNLIINCDNKIAKAMYYLLLMGWVVLAFIRFGKKGRLQAVKYVTAAGTMFVLSYLPSLVVYENYSSNRTMLAIDMCVWIVWVEMALYFVKHIQLRRVIAISVATVLVIAGWYNFNKQFLQPIHKEYMAVKNYMQQHYNKNITTVHFIGLPQNAFEKKFHLQSSMDEFGVPTTAAIFDWMPLNLTWQLAYEKTGNRETAGHLTVKYWKDDAAFAHSGERAGENTLVVNMPELINALYP